MIPDHDVSGALKLMAGTVLDAVVAIDGSGIVIEWNAVAERHFGWTRAEAVGQALATLIVPGQHRAAHTQGMARYNRTGETHVLNQRIEISAIDKNGREFPIELSIVPMSETGSTIFVGFIRDISERKGVDEALSENRSFLADILQSSGEAFYAVDRAGVTTLCNQAFLRLIGFEREEDAIALEAHVIERLSDLAHHRGEDAA